MMNCAAMSSTTWNARAAPGTRHGGMSMGCARRQLSNVELHSASGCSTHQASQEIAPQVKVLGGASGLVTTLESKGPCGRRREAASQRDEVGG